ncbi:MAG TPA: MmcQ/YjbR family DNA-binding protein [Acidisarcina sp.]
MLSRMDAESARAFLLKLPNVVETMQWGNNLVFWVGDKSIGGKMFALVDLDPPAPAGARVMSFSAGPERFAELIERDGVIPAPYAARLYWVALQHWNAIAAPELTSLLRDAHQLTYTKLPQRTRDVLALPRAELRKVVTERRQLLAGKAAGKQTPSKVKKASKHPAAPEKTKSLKGSARPASGARRERTPGQI